MWVENNCHIRNQNIFNGEKIMPHQDYSEICPIFNEGVEKELAVPIQLSCTTTTYPAFIMSFGREVVVQEAFIQANNSTGLTTALSMTSRLYKNLSTAIASISGATAAFSDTLGTILFSASMTSTAFTSTDTISLYFLEGAGACKPSGNALIIRYRDA